MNRSEQWLAEYQFKHSRLKPQSEILRETISKAKEPKPSKYRNQKVVIDGINFSSKREGERYRQLKMLEAAGKVSDLTLQRSFELAPAVTIGGKNKRPLRYVCDFSYIQNGEVVIEDSKGMRTDVYIVKRHLMKAIHSIDILET